MEIRLEQKMAAAYLALGIACGVFSNYLAESMLLYALLLPLAVYAISVAVLAKLMRGQKKSQLISNSLLTFMLVWAVVWVFLYNL